MEIGLINKLKIARRIDFGYILVGEEQIDVLLPNAYVTDQMQVGQDIDVFLYKDSEDRIVASTLLPIAMRNEFAYLKVKETNSMGAFLDWGLPKDLLVPFSKQKEKMEAGKSYLIYILRDEKTERLFATSKITGFFEPANADDFIVGQEVDALFFAKSDLGLNAIVNNKYKALLFRSDIHREIPFGETIKAYVKNVREDGKLDLALEPQGFKQSIDLHADKVVKVLQQHDGFVAIGDNSSPEEINALFGMSKKAFKRACGNLFKSKIIALETDGIRLLSK